MDSDSEEWDVFLEYLDSTRPRSLRDRSDPMAEFDDVEFRMRFRLPKPTVLSLLHIYSGAAAGPPVGLPTCGSCITSQSDVGWVAVLCHIIISGTILI